MEEFVGFCSECGKQIYCIDGFLNGVVSDDKKGCIAFSAQKKMRRTPLTLQKRRLTISIRPHA
ncbi:hypothetical protein PB1_04810 [Bacillus methanolicus PB1]|uniref:Uncharacterized protein n=1 Tax=Bacillus methanolicus PB1 TaxID=997296 RepID=I3E6V3_BACMT|nr:hypothetical protein [Bacillus methanolicus]EIJ82224.1 hypothetical protein PB1_04810 [Bacillus methanolicus PB1]